MRGTKDLKATIIVSTQLFLVSWRSFDPITEIAIKIKFIAQPYPRDHRRLTHTQRLQNTPIEDGVEGQQRQNLRLRSCFLRVEHRRGGVSSPGSRCTCRRSRRWTRGQPRGWPRPRTGWGRGRGPRSSPGPRSPWPGCCRSPPGAGTETEGGGTER